MHVYHHPSAGLLGIFALQRPVLAARSSNKHLDEPCFETCEMTLSPTKFQESNVAGIDSYAPLPFRRALCENCLAQTSLYLCTSLYCTVTERNIGLDAENATCLTSHNKSLPSFDEITAGYNADKISRLQHLEQQEAYGIFEEVVLPSERYFGLVFDTLVRVIPLSHRNIPYSKNCSS